MTKQPAPPSSPDDVFRRRYTEMKVFTDAIEQHQKATRKALAAFQQVNGTLEALVNVLAAMVDSPEISPNCSGTLAVVAKDVSLFKMSDGYVNMSLLLSRDVKELTGDLAKRAGKLRLDGKARKVAREAVDKYTKKKAKDPAYTEKLRLAEEQFKEKERKYSEAYKVMCYERERQIPFILLDTLQVARDFAAHLASSITTAHQVLGNAVSTAWNLAT